MDKVASVQVSRVKRKSAFSLLDLNSRLQNSLYYNTYAFRILESRKITAILERLDVSENKNNANRGQLIQKKRKKYSGTVEEDVDKIFPGSLYYTLEKMR